MITCLLAAAALIAVYVIYAYNQAVKYRNYVREAFSTMDVYLKKRWDLLPNLIETVKSYANHEKNVFYKIASLRSKNYSSLSNSEKIELNSEVSSGLSSLVAVAENYPDLKANQNYALLMEQLDSIENDIAMSRKYYNGTVRELNNFLEIFPSCLIGKIFNFQTEKMFEIDESQRESVKVEL